MKITINPKNLIVDDSYQFFRKVRAIITNDQGEYAISIEGVNVFFQEVNVIKMRMK